MDRCEIDRYRIGSNRTAEIAERIVRDRRSDELTRGRIEDRIGRVQDSVVFGDRHLLLRTVVLDFTVAEASIVAPVAIDQLIAFDTKSSEESVTGVIKRTIAELSQTGTATTGDNLVKRIERVKCVCRDVGRVFTGSELWLPR